MNPAEYLTVIRARWRIVLGAMVLGLAAAAAFFALGPAQYSTSVTMFVVASPGDPPSTSFERAQLAQQRVVSYSELATDPRVTSAVVRDVAPGEAPDELAARVEATGIADSLLLRLTVHDPAPRRAAEVANDVALRLTELVRELESPPGSIGEPDVAVRMVQPAAVPTTADRMPLTPDLVVGGLVGMLVGVLAAVAAEIADSRVRSAAVLERVTRAPLLGSVPRSRVRTHRPFATLEKASPARVESLRALRIRLRGLKPRPQIVLAAGVLRDDDSVSAVLDLASSLAAAGSSVLVVDADLRHPSLDAVLESPPAAGLTEVLRRELDAAAATRRMPDGFDVLTAGVVPAHGAAELLESPATAELLAWSRTSYDLVLLVGPPLLEVADATALAPLVDGVVLVCPWNVVPVRRLDAAVASIGAVSATVLGAVFSAAPLGRRDDRPARRDTAVPAAPSPAAEPGYDDELGDPTYSGRTAEDPSTESDRSPMVDGAGAR